MTHRATCLILTCLIAFTSLSRPVVAGDDSAPDPAPQTQFTSLMVFPESISLERARDRQRFVVIALDRNGLSHDVTAEAAVDMTGAPNVRLEAGHMLPVTDGEGQVTVTYGGHTVVVPVTVRDFGQDPALSFRLDVIPTLTASGCNTGECHGSARGQDGFHLSLFGYDPEGDYFRLTRQFPGRRLDLAFPHASLLIDKATGQVAHTGSKLFEKDSRPYHTLTRWIREGATNDSQDVAHVTGISLVPRDALLAGRDQALQFVLRAAYSDGTDRDVTELAIFASNNDVSAAVTRNGRLTSGDPGEAFVTARFDTFTVGSPVIVLADASPFTFVDPAQSVLAANYVDQHIQTKLEKLRLQPTGLCTDERFVRRVYLDILGMLPSLEERASFLADEEPSKRSRLVDTLLERREFADLWVMQWAELLQIRSNNRISEKAALLYFEWVRNAIASNMPVDEMLRLVLTASGGTFGVPATNFYQNQDDNLVLAENVAQAFLGIRLQCAQCHNHPFDRWTQDDYYGFAAFFSQVGRKRAEDPRETIVFNTGRGEVNHPVGGRVMAPKFLGDDVPDVKGKDRREVIAEWLTAPDNPWFARSLANRVWTHFMGVGIIDPVDDLRITNPPSNEALLNDLGTHLVSYDYDFKQLVRDICNSRAYQRATVDDGVDDRSYARGRVRRLRAETLLDIVCQATEVPEKFKGLPLGARAVEIADGTTSTYFLTTFGRSPRETVSACEVSVDPSLSQALHLINGAAVSGKIAQGNLIGKRLDEGVPPDELIDELYLRSLARLPTLKEANALMAVLSESGEIKATLEDTFWAILNSREFVFNH